MKKNIILFVAFIIVWFWLAGLCYLLGLILNRDWFTEYPNYVVIGFSGAVAGIFGPILAAWLQKILKKKS